MLFALSEYSTKFGVVPIKDLVQEVKNRNYNQFVLSDINNTTSVLETFKTAKQFDIQLVAGCSVRRESDFLYVLIAKNNKGYFEINQFISAHPKFDFPDHPIFSNDVVIIFTFGREPKILSNNAKIGVSLQELNKIRWKKQRLNLSNFVLLHFAIFRNKQDFNTHRLLRAIDQNVLLSKLSKQEEANEEQGFHDLSELQEKCFDIQELMYNTQHLLDGCTLDFEFGTNKNLKTFTNNSKEDYNLLRRLTMEGIPYRYQKLTSEIEIRIEKELEIIQQKEFVSYFLINWDMLEYARKRGFYYVGRGSGSNSIVAYLLKITDVDPIELDLYFERFINLYRENPPDFDIDFSWKDRDEILNYLFSKYENISLLATYNTFQYRGVIRELGKVFGMPTEEIEILSKDKYGTIPPDSLASLVLKYGKLIHGKPNHLSIHAGGVLISEKPIEELCATFLPPKDYPTAQIDMYIAEEIGLYKFDILSQRGLAKVRDALDLIAENQPNEQVLDLRRMDLLKTDPKTLEILENGEAIGCFYVESPAMRMLFKKLKVKDYLGLVAASSIIRPGVSSSGMMQEYILRSQDPERVKKATPKLLEIMPDTYGVMVYQEDVIKVAHIFGGLSLAEADVLRRGMSGKYRGKEEFDRCKNAFFTNCKSSGYEDQLTQDIWRQIESFAGYAFSKGHSASYAVESFQALYLKAHFPIEYMVSTINNGGGYYDFESYLHELRMFGATIHEPCVNKSNVVARLIGKDVFLGFGIIDSIQEESIKNILMARRNGLFTGFQNFVERVKISFEQLILVINVDAFRFTGKNSRQVLLEAYKTTKKKDVTLPQLFKLEKKLSLPELEYTWQEKAFDQMEFFGFTLLNPFDLISRGFVSNIKVSDFQSNINSKVISYGYLVGIKKTKTVNGELMYFGTFRDMEGSFLDTVHFPIVAKSYPFMGKGVYKIEGFVREEFTYLSLEVTRMKKEAYIDDPRFS